MGVLMPKKSKHQKERNIKVTDKELIEILDMKKVQYKCKYEDAILKMYLDSMKNNQSMYERFLEDLQSLAQNQLNEPHLADFLQIIISVLRYNKIHKKDFCNELRQKWEDGFREQIKIEQNREKGVYDTEISENKAESHLKALKDADVA